MIEIFEIPPRLYSAFLLQKVNDFWQKSMIFDKIPWFFIKNPWLARGPGEIKDFEIIFSHAGQYQKVPQRNKRFPNIRTWLYIGIFQFMFSVYFGFFLIKPLFWGPWGPRPLQNVKDTIKNNIFQWCGPQGPQNRGFMISKK